MNAAFPDHRTSSGRGVTTRGTRPPAAAMSAIRWVCADASTTSTASNPRLLAPAQLEAAHIERAGPTLAGGGAWSSPQWDVAFVSESVPWPEFPVPRRFDAVVLHRLPYVADDDLGRILAATDHVVLAAPLPWGLRGRVRDRCRAAGIACHDVRDQGAFILER